MSREEFLYNKEAMEYDYKLNNHKKNTASKGLNEYTLVNKKGKIQYCRWNKFFSTFI